MKLHHFLPRFLIKFQGIVFQQPRNFRLDRILEPPMRIAANKTGFVKNQIRFRNGTGQNMLNSRKIERHEKWASGKSEVHNENQIAAEYDEAFESSTR